MAKTKASTMKLLFLVIIYDGTLAQLWSGVSFPNFSYIFLNPLIIFSVYYKIEIN